MIEPCQKKKEIKVSFVLYAKRIRISKGISLTYQPTVATVLRTKIVKILIFNFFCFGIQVPF